MAMKAAKPRIDSQRAENERVVEDRVRVMAIVKRLFDEMPDEQSRLE